METHIRGGRSDGSNDLLCILFFHLLTMNDVYWYFNAATIMSCIILICLYFDHDVESCMNFMSKFWPNVE